MNRKKWVGILAGLVGAVVYLLLSVLEVATFSWIGLGIFGGVTAVLVLEGEGTIAGEAFGRYDTFFIPADAGEVKMSGCFTALLSTL